MDENGKFGEYDGIDQYLSQNRIHLNRDDVADIMSAMNEKEAVLQVVKSTPFFRLYDTYSEMESHRNDTDLFQVSDTDNIAFAQLA